MSEATDGWYVRARGRILGPFTTAQLVSLRDRGQLSQFHEVSQDRRTWTKAANVQEVFAASAGFSVEGGADLPIYSVVEEPGQATRPAAAESAPGWFYAQGDKHNGPYPIVELQRLIDSGLVGPTTLVWRAGLPNWLPAQQVPDLRIHVTPTALVAAFGPMAQQAAFGANLSSQPYLPRTSGLAIASLVLGLLWLCGIGSLIATVFGAVAISQISRSNGALLGREMAIAGLVLGIVGLSLYAIFPFLFGFTEGFLRAILR